MADDIKHPRVDEDDARVRAGVERHDAAVADRRLARQQELRQLGQSVGAVAPVNTTTETGSQITLYNWVNRSATSSDFIIRNVEGFQYLIRAAA
jgi:hypothetical protein